MRTLVFSPHVPLALWVALAVAAAALLVWYALASRPRLTAGRHLLVISLMALGFVLPLIILLNPTWLETIPPPAGKPLLTLLVDTSQSMQTSDASGGVTRIEAAQKLADEVRDRLEARYDVRLLTFAGDADELLAIGNEQLAAEGELTDLGSALLAGIAENRPQGQAMLLLSDGIHNAGSTASVLSASGKARAMDVPIFAHTLGGKLDVKNLKVQLRSPQELAFTGQELAIEAQLSHLGLAGATVEVGLWHEGNRIDQKQVALPVEGSADVGFKIVHDETGLYRYDLRASPLTDEATEADNRSALLLRIVDEPVGVLLLEAKPYWDTKFLMRNLAADPSIRLTSFVQLAEGRLLKRSIQSALPNAAEPPPVNQTTADVSADATSSKLRSTPPGQMESWSIVAEAGDLVTGDFLAEYQVVVLGRDADIFLTPVGLESLRDWVNQEGGSLVCSRGAPTSQVSQRLAPLLPVRWKSGRESRFRVQLTERGREVRWLDTAAETEELAGLPSLAVAAQPEGPKVATVVLATAAGAGEGETTPVISYQPYGTGRVVVVEGAGMWRWAFLPPRYAGQQHVFAQLWRSLFRWLISRAALLPGQDRSLQMDKITYATSEPIFATLLTREESTGATSQTAVLRTAEGTVVKRYEPRPLGDEPGIYRIALGQLPEGDYFLQLEHDKEDGQPVQTAFEVRAPWVERLDVAARPVLMKRIADDSGGLALDEVDSEEVVAAFTQHLARTRPERVRRTTAWDQWWVFALILGIWATAWGVRRASGLI